MATAGLRQTFIDEGYLVIPGVIPPGLCEAVIDAIREFTGVDPDRPGVDEVDRFAGLGIVPIHHHQALWDVRQHPALHEVFARLYADERLWVTIDRAGYKPPASAATRDWEMAAVHWDCNPWRQVEFGIQGLVYLTDTSEDQGAFSCVPSIYRNLDRWLADHDEQTGRRPDIGSEPLVPVAGAAGSLVVFHRLMPHTNGRNLSDRPRLAQYVSMDPAGAEAARIERIGLWQDKMPPAWAARQKVPGQVVPEPGEPATLTALGRKLLGVDVWD